MNSLLDKPIVLSLNRVWQVIGHRTVKQALVALTGGGDGLPPALGLDIAYPHEAGLRLLRTPKAPPLLPVAASLREPKHPDWRHFLVR